MSSVPIIIHGCKILFTFLFQNGVRGASAVDKICPVGLNKFEDKTINETTFTATSGRFYFSCVISSCINMRNHELMNSQVLAQRERGHQLTLTDAIKPLPLDLFVFVHQSHRPSSLNLGPRMKMFALYSPVDVAHLSSPEQKQEESEKNKEIFMRHDRAHQKNY